MATDHDEFPPLDTDVLLACVDLIGRAGAKNFEIGYLNDADDPAYATHGAQWWAKAQYQGHRISVDGFALPDTAAEALARKVLKGAKCRCGRLVRLAGAHAAFAHLDAEMADGTRWTADEAKRAGQCEWRRIGPKWEPSCDAPPIRLNRAQRRRR